MEIRKPTVDDVLKPRPAGRKNVYLCDTCGHGFISEDVDEGVTPFITTCLNCSGRAYSLCYSINQEILAKHPSAVEWYKPSDEELAGNNEIVKDHVRKGGLLSRKVQRT